MRAGGQGIRWRCDPRLPSLGYRAIVPANEKPSLDTAGDESALGHAYRRWRIAHGLAEGDSEIP